MKRRIRAALVLIAVVVLAVACSSDGFPVSYEDQVDPETGLSNVEMNWKLGCEPALSEELADAAVEICGCSYRGITRDIAFEDFVAVNDQLASNPEILRDLSAEPNTTAAQLVDIVRDCIAQA